LIRQDRVNVAYDETNVAGVVTQSPIAITMQTFYSDQGAPTVQKNYNNVTLDVDTNGQTLTAELLFDDGESTLAIGTVSTTERNRVNLNINAGDGFQAYKVSLLLTGSGTQRIFLYQASIDAIPLATTRQSWDSYWIKQGAAESKIAKEIYIDYNASAPIVCTVYYDESALVDPFVFKLPQFNGVRNSFRQRLPAVKYRLIRLVMDSAGNDFQIWDSSAWNVKPVKQGSGYEKIPLLAVEK
jgi:hypothetical protein